MATWLGLAVAAAIAAAAIPKATAGNGGTCYPSFVGGQGLPPGYDIYNRTGHTVELSDAFHKTKVTLKPNQRVDLGMCHFGKLNGVVEPFYVKIEQRGKTMGFVPINAMDIGGGNVRHFLPFDHSAIVVNGRVIAVAAVGEDTPHDAKPSKSVFDPP